MRRLITAFFRLCLSIFFRRIELVGLELVPANSPVVFAVNHPNGLVDPLFLLCYAPAPVSFLAKAPLFSTPVIGWFVRTFAAIPVYRKQDNTSGTNQETFARARQVLEDGGSIAIFPEGTTHDDPRLRELKTGASRIALGAELPRIEVVPAGIYYTEKHVFRSSALVMFGAPLTVRPVPTGADGEPPVHEVEKLTAAIEEGLHEVTLQADSRAALQLVARAEDIFSADDEQPLAQELDLRRRFVEGYHYLREHDPGRLDRLQSALTQFESELRKAKIDVHDLRPRVDPLRLFRVLVLLPVAFLGALLNLPTYLFVHALAGHLAKGEGNMVATMKFLVALLLYPVTYLGLAAAVGWRFGWVAGVASALVLPVLSYVALRVVEAGDEVIGDLRAVSHRMFRRHGHAHLSRQRHAIRDEMIEVWRAAESAKGA